MQVAADEVVELVGALLRVLDLRARRGDFVVEWSSKDQDGSNYGVFGQRYAASGAPLGGEFRVNTTTLGDQYQPAAAAFSAASSFVAMPPVPNWLWLSPLIFRVVPLISVIKEILWASLYNLGSRS